MIAVRRWIHNSLAGAAFAALAACASVPGAAVRVTHIAPRVSAFHFDSSAPLTDARDFAPWASLTSGNLTEAASLDACISDRRACATTGLVRYRRLLELATDLAPADQLDLVQGYFNTVDWVPQERTSTPTRWGSLYQVAATAKADCKGIALGKYFTLRRLGWAADDLRIVMGWDQQQRDWHALLAARIGGETFVLDSILGRQRPASFASTFMVYSISELGIWDHAPDYVPGP